MDERRNRGVGRRKGDKDVASVRKGLDEHLADCTRERIENKKIVEEIRTEQQRQAAVQEQQSKVLDDQTKDLKQLLIDVSAVLAGVKMVRWTKRAALHFLLFMGSYGVGAVALIDLWHRIKHP